MSTDLLFVSQEIQVVFEYVALMVHNIVLVMYITVVPR